MVLKDTQLFQELSVILRGVRFQPKTGIADVDYVTDIIGLDMYLSFVGNDEIKNLKKKLPQNVLFLFSDRFTINAGNIDVQPKLVGIFTDKVIKSLQKITTKNNKHIYEIL